MVTTIDSRRVRRDRRTRSARTERTAVGGRPGGGSRKARGTRARELPEAPAARPAQDGDDRSRRGPDPVEDGTPAAGRGDGRRLRWDDAGMATAEYAIATVAAAGFAGLLIAILRSDEVRGLLLGIVRGALST